MDCHKYIDLMTEYMEDDLSTDARAIWQKHFNDCPACADFFKSFESSVDLVKFIETEGCPSGVRKRLDRFLQERLNIAPSA